MHIKITVNITDKKRVEQATNRVDSDVQVCLKYKLSLLGDEIVERYASYVSSLCEAVIDKGVTLRKFQVYILSLSALKCSYVEGQPGFLTA